MSYFLLRVNIQTLDIAARENAKTYGNHSFRTIRYEVTAMLFALWRLQRLDQLDAKLLENGLQSLDLVLGSIESMAIIKFVPSTCSIDGNEVRE